MKLSELQVGDRITDPVTRKIYDVRQIEPCPASRRGVLKLHVNGGMCFDSIAPLIIIPSKAHVNSMYGKGKTS
jgi:hypothetical protein